MTVSRGAAAASEEARRPARSALCVLFVLAAAARLAGNDFGIPWMQEPDPESVLLAKSLASGQSWSHLLEPSRYPHFLVYLLVPVYAAFPDANVMWVGRVLSGLFGAGTTVLTCVAATYAAGRRAGLLAGLIVCFGFLGVLHGHLVKPHVPVTFFTTACVYLCMKVVEHGRSRDQLLAAAAGAAAFATLHSGALSAASLLVAQCIAPGKVRGWRRLVTKRAWLTAAIFLVAVPVGYPNRIVDLVHIARGEAEWSALLFPHDPSTDDSVGAGGYLRVFWYLVEFEPWLLLLGAPALVLGAVKRPRWFRVCLPGLALVLATMLVFGHILAFVPRFLLPTFPVLAIFAAALVVRWIGGLGPAGARVAFAAACVAIAGPPLVLAARLDQLYLRRDTRDLAAEWIRANVKPDDGIAATPYTEFPLSLTHESLLAHRKAIVNLPREEQRDLRAFERGESPSVDGTRYRVTFPFPFQRTWPVPPAERAQVLAQDGVRFGLGVFTAPEEYAHPAYNVFAPLGERVFTAAPGPPGFFGFNPYLVRWPYLTLWRMERPGPLVEIVQLRAR